jgi:hypothetical protein
MFVSHYIIDYELLKFILLDCCRYSFLIGFINRYFKYIDLKNLYYIALTVISQKWSVLWV